MLARESRNLKRSPFGLPIARVSFLRILVIKRMLTVTFPDANLFKEAFIKAQQENEALFKQD